MIVRYRAQALADIDEIYQYLDERNPSVRTPHRTATVVGRTWVNLQ